MTKLKYETMQFGEFDLHVCTLQDSQQYGDADGEAERLGISSAQWSLFGVTWDAGVSLARHALDIDIQDRRILEVGCGIGLASLVLNRRGANITAMDYHPEAGNFLNRNVKLNGDPEIPFFQANWKDETPSLGRFDLIIGSDVLYEQGHAEELGGFLSRHLNPKGQVIISDPRRGLRGRFSKVMESNGFQFEHSSEDDIHFMNFLRG